MNFDVAFPYHGHNYPAVIALVAGVLVLLLVYYAEKFSTRVVLLGIACGLLAGAYWWFTHIRS